MRGMVVEADIRGITQGAEEERWRVIHGRRERRNRVRKEDRRVIE